MKILLIGFSDFNYTEYIGKALNELGHQVRIELWDDFFKNASPWEKKLTKKLGIKFCYTSYYQKMNQRFLRAGEEFQPDLCLVINGYIVLTSTLAKWRAQGIKVVLWMLDSIKRYQMVFEQIPVNPTAYDRCFIFDPSDVEFIRNRFKAQCTYATLGFDPELFYPDEAVARDIDLSFIGAPILNRQEILKKVAEYALANNKKFVFYGNCWKVKPFRRITTSKRKFITKFSPLEQYAQNTTIDPRGAAQIYRRSKICLNIHVDIHQGINARTFEILGTKSFQLVDHKAKLAELVRVGTDLVEYTNDDDLMAKIDYYLKNDRLREEIAAQGYEYAATHCTMKHMVKKLLEDCESSWK